VLQTANNGINIAVIRIITVALR